MVQVDLQVLANGGGCTAARHSGSQVSRLALCYRASSCNEPDERIPVELLCDHYEACIEAIRGSGMSPDRVAVVLPIFPHFRAAEIRREWSMRGNFLRYDNIAFDIHYYHCFSAIWGFMSHEQHLQVCEAHAQDLGLLPGAVVGEWSLARQNNVRFSEEEKSAFGMSQIAAYGAASHGWFFWNWNDHERLDSWDMRRGVFGRGRLPSPLGKLVQPQDPKLWATPRVYKGFWPKALAFVERVFAIIGPCGRGGLPTRRAVCSCLCRLFFLR